MVSQQIIRPVGTGAHGKRVKVAGSGTRYMSNSAVRATDSTDEPSNHTPCSRAADSSSTGMVTVFTEPVTSVNWRSRWRMPAASAAATTSGVGGRERAPGMDTP